MKFLPQRFLPILLAAAALPAHAQFYKIHGGAVALGGDGLFTTTLTSSPNNYQTNVPTPTGGVLNDTVSGQQQYTTLSAGFYGSFQFHPKPWAGVEVNYGYSKYSERYAFNYSSAASTERISIPTSFHEATAAYQFHPKHIPFQPFVNIGGGALDFLPSQPVFADNQWRWTGLIEAGFDLPTKNPHLAFRVMGRDLIYRAPNFYSSAISSRTWRSTEEPTAAVVFRF